MFRTVRRLILGIMAAAEWFLWQYFLRKRKTSKSDDIVVIMADVHIGDFLMALPFFQRVSAFYKRKLILISDKRIESLALESGCFAKVIPVKLHHRNLLLRIKTFWQLRKLNAGILIHKYALGIKVTDQIFAALIPAQVKFGVQTIEGVRTAAGYWHFYNKMWLKNFTTLYKYDYNLSILGNETAFADLICGTVSDDPVGTLECFEPLPPPDETLGKYALFIPGADDPKRRWEAEKFAAVAAKLLQNCREYKVLFAGSPAELPVIEAVCAALPEELRSRVVIHLPLPEYIQSVKRLMSDVKYADFVLTNDTAPLHIAAKCQVPCFSLSGGWHWGYFSPCPEYRNVVTIHKDMECYNCFGVCRFPGAPFGCLREVTVEMVWQELEKHIRKNGFA